MVGDGVVIGVEGLGHLRNDIAYGATLTSNMSGTNAAYNSWDLSVTMSNAQFQSGV